MVKARNWQHWRGVWEQALRNMPTKPWKCYCPKNPKCLSPCNHKSLLGLYGAQSALAKCLGYCNHTGVYHGWYNGSKPRGKRLERLLKCAGPWGNVLAKMHLAKPTSKFGKDLPQWRLRRYRSIWEADYDGHHIYYGDVSRHLVWINPMTRTVKVGRYRYLNFGPI